MQRAVPSIHSINNDDSVCDGRLSYRTFAWGPHCHFPVPLHTDIQSSYAALLCRSAIPDPADDLRGVIFFGVKKSISHSILQYFKRSKWLAIQANNKYVLLIIDVTHLNLSSSSYSSSFSRQLPLQFKRTNAISTFGSVSSSCCSSSFRPTSMLSGIVLFARILFIRRPKSIILYSFNAIDSYNYTIQPLY
uniref:Uncharacterized protein n=1 Tax=Ascaris lumbricoides TaxID=6252 RepID=A0A0M3HZE8_ASCLU